MNEDQTVSTATLLKCYRYVENLEYYIRVCETIDYGLRFKEEISSLRRVQAEMKRRLPFISANTDYLKIVEDLRKAWRRLLRLADSVESVYDTPVDFPKTLELSD